MFRFIVPVLILSALLWGCHNSPGNKIPADGGVDADADTGSDTDGEIPEDCTDRITEEIMIPVGDGAQLSAFVVRPENPACRMPTVLVQTPYSKAGFKAEFFDNPQASHPLFESRDYAFVVLDWRGFFGSSAAPPASFTRGYGEDGHDVIAWIAQQPWSDGNVGTWGTSALCRVQFQTAVLRPLALKAAVPIFCQMNYTYEETYPGGVIRKEYIDFLGAYFGAGIFAAHPLRDNWWIAAERLYRASDIHAPMLLVAGWFDLYNTGTVQTFLDLKDGSATAVRPLHRLLAGPWHLFASGGESTGMRPLTEQELLFFDADREIERASLRFFDQHLRGMDPAETDAPVTFRRSLEGPWETAGNWPPTDTTVLQLHLNGDGRLAPTAGPVTNITLPVNPFDPSPTAGGQTLVSSQDHGPTCQDPVIARADAFVLTTEELADPLHLQGTVTLAVNASTDMLDADVAFRLVDLRPDGCHLLLSDGIARLSMPPPYNVRNLPVAGQPVPVTVKMTNHVAWTLSPGHRLGLILSGSNFPRFDVNPHNGEIFFNGTGVPANLTLHLDATAILLVEIRP